MAGKVFFSVSMSLDGYSAPESMDGIFATPDQRAQDPRLERWVAQWMEMLDDPDTKIARPRQIYTGYGERPYDSQLDYGHKVAKKDAVRR